MKKLLAKKTHVKSGADAKVRAEELAERANNATTAPQARELLQQALRLDPDCVGAIVTLTFLDARTPEETIEGLRRAIEAGERALGVEFIAEHRGQFWALLETRPYMNALELLALNYKSKHLYQDAIAIYERMLDLSPSDNQGARYPLLLLNLAVGNLSAARGMIAGFRDDTTAFFAWSRVLERLLTGDTVAAKIELQKARRVNPYVEQYLVEKLPFPAERPTHCKLGSEEEASLCAFELFSIWKNNKEPFFWIFQQLDPEYFIEVSTAQELLDAPANGRGVQ